MLDKHASVQKLGVSKLFIQINAALVNIRLLSKIKYYRPQKTQNGKVKHFKCYK